MNQVRDPAFGELSVIVRWIGYGLLIICLPIALFGVVALPNEYAAMGFGGIDCDGPEHVFLFAYPAFAIYGAAAVINGLGARKR